MCVRGGGAHNLNPYTPKLVTYNISSLDPRPTPGFVLQFAFSVSLSCIILKNKDGGGLGMSVINNQPTTPEIKGGLKFVHTHCTGCVVYVAL